MQELRELATRNAEGLENERRRAGRYSLVISGPGVPGPAEKESLIKIATRLVKDLSNIDLRATDLRDIFRRVFDCLSLYIRLHVCL